MEPERTKKYAAEKKLAFDDALMKNAELKQIIYDDIIRLANENKFNGLEKPKQLYLLKDPWTVEDGHLTPTQKLKRPQAKVMYKEQIEELYSLPKVMAPSKK